MTNPRVVVVTGASGGVGRAIAIELARRGDKVALLARGRDGLEGARRDVEDAGGTGFVVPCDVAEHDQVEGAAALIEREFGEIDVWVNNAMATIFSPIHLVEPDEFERATRVTYLGAVWGTMAALRRFRARDRGTIVQVGSALAYRAIPLQAPYCGAKHALRGFTDSLRTELLHDRSNVKITMVHLPAMNTPQFDWGRSRMPKHPQPVPPIFQPEVAARAIVHAIDHHRREYYVGWPTVKAIVGNKVAPSFADRVLARMGYDAQQTDEPVPANRPDNLFEPVDRSVDHGTHGGFDALSKPVSVQSWMNLHRPAMLGAAAALVTLGALLVPLVRRG